MENIAFGAFFFAYFFAGFFGLCLIVGIVMKLLECIPFVRKKLNDFYDSLPMSSPDWD